MGEIDFPSISVIIPSFNQGEYIEDTLLSVIGQRYPNIEILVIDGGSTDDTVAIIEKYSPYISYWQSKQDAGQADAINQGMKHASGEILCWLNSDDSYLPGTFFDIGKQFAGVVEQPYLIYGAAIAFHEHQGNLWSFAQTAMPFQQERLTYHDYMVQPSTFWTRRLWEIVGELNVEYTYVLDWDWFIRASHLITFEYIPKFYTTYRFHPSHKSSNGGNKRRREILKVVETYAPTHWNSLYHRIDQNYHRMTIIKKYLEFFRIPMRYELLPYFFPLLNIKMRPLEHVKLAWRMYA